MRKRLSYAIYRNNYYRCWDTCVSRGLNIACAQTVSEVYNILVIGFQVHAGAGFT